MDEHDEHDQPEALEGEILIYRDYPREEYSGQDGRRGPRTRKPGATFGPRSYDESLVEQVIHYKISHPHEPLREIGLRFGISASTVHRWTSERIEERSQQVDVVRKRTEAAIELEAARAEAWKVYDACKGRAASDYRAIRTALEALRTVDMLSGSHAKLLGLEMPKKIDVQVTELTEAERELQEMITEAQARTHAREADVIAESSADPDL